MISFPKDIIATYAHVGLKHAEMDAVTIPADGSFKGGNVLQTKHCLELVLSGTMRVHFNDQYQDITQNDILFKKEEIISWSPMNNIPQYYFSSMMILLSIL